MTDYSRKSNEELCLLLRESAPDVAVVVGEVHDSNRETVIAFLKLLPGLREKDDAGRGPR